MATEQPTEAPKLTPTSAAQAALLQAALGGPAGRLPVSRLSDVVPRDALRDLVATIRAYREAQDDDSHAAHLLTRVHDQAEAIAWPSTTPPPESTPVLVVLPDADGLAELLRLAVNAGDRDVHGPGVVPFPPLHELAAEHEDRLVLEAAARHLHPLITSLVLADQLTGADDGANTTDFSERSAR